MRNRILLTLLLLSFYFFTFSQYTVYDLQDSIASNFNFILVSDLGRNGYYDQKK